MSETSQEQAGPQRTLQEKQDYIKALKEKLQDLHQHKEAAYVHAQDLRKKIQEQVNVLKHSRGQRDVFTSQIKEQKKVRDQLHSQLKQKSVLLQQAEERLKEILPMSNDEHKRVHLRHPDQIKKQIAAIQHTIETEGVSFEKEKKLMKEINDLKKEFIGSSAALDILSQKGKLLQEVRDLRKQANFTHREISHNAGSSQEKHNVLLAVAKDLDALRAEEKNAFTSFTQLKKEYNTLHAEFDALQKELYGLHEQVRSHKEEKRKQYDAQERKNIEALQREVVEKLKKGSGVKLTLKDLLAFQSMDKD